MRFLQFLCALRALRRVKEQRPRDFRRIQDARCKGQALNQARCAECGGGRMGSDWVRIGSGLETTDETVNADFIIVPKGGGKMKERLSH